MTNQLFSVVGITVRNGNAKVRYTNDMCRRIKQFSKGGASRLDFIDLPNAMTKIDALNYMLTHPSFQSPDDQAAISDTLSDKIFEANKGRGVVVKIKPSITSLDAIKSRPRIAQQTDKPVVSAEDVLAALHSE